jgi:hypothetical protein
MKTCRCINVLAAAALAVAAAGCASSQDQVGVTNQNQPGPVIGRAVGSGIGAVSGNVAGAGVGVVEGTTAGIHSAFDNTQRVVRYWREEKTPDGRIILVPEDFLVDANGQVIRRMK